MSEKSPLNEDQNLNLNLLNHPDRFVNRHLGPSSAQRQEMLNTLGLKTLEELVDKTVPKKLQTTTPLRFEAETSEYELLRNLRSIADRNKVFRSYIGMGYYDTITPGVIQRNIFENPGWYTQYTPYQAEISQGRLESLLNFQTMICDLTGLEISNASLLDEATAAAEGMALCLGVKSTETGGTFFVSELCHPQTIAVVKTRALPLGIILEIGNHTSYQPGPDFLGALVQYPATDGSIHDYREFADKVHAAKGLLVVATDLLALTLLTPPGEFGADVAVGSAQRFGVPLGYGGPHAAFFATRDRFKRQMPGRLIGVSKDAQGRPGYRLSLQTREQHIRREKATSNICTAQALLANMAAMYAVYHGPEGLRQIASRLHQLTALLALGLQRLGYTVQHEFFFDTLSIRTGLQSAADICALAEDHQVNLRRVDSTTIGISLDETTNVSAVDQLFLIFNQGQPPNFTVADLQSSIGSSGVLNREPFIRRTRFLQHAVFNQYHSETELLRYIRRLESRDLSLTSSMIPLGSCTMKLNATVEMFPVSWAQFGKLHPFVPLDQSLGYQQLFSDLEHWLAEITGFTAVSLQPNAGSAGEYAGLLAIHDYHRARQQAHRNICLIPTSAHGTNPASAVMAGMQVVAVACDAQGNIDLNDLNLKAEAHQEKLAALMITYPSTHGVFEEGVREACAMIHRCGGQVYMDGANMNAQVGLTKPGELGADVCHLNLHKTFCIPHGGGGPGMGPICVANHLAAFLPKHPVVSMGGQTNDATVSAAPWGSASILPISWVYIALMGGEGLKLATQVAILNANYVASRLDPFYPVLYRGTQGMVAHECILDLRGFKKVTVEDVAKRLMDYSFHAPTISWPVPGTMMIEPTESESKGELDRFCDALISIHAEIMAIESGQVDGIDNLLKNAPHTAQAVISDQWTHDYSRAQAAFPAPWLHHHKFWPSVGRIDNVFGDRNLICSCVGMDNYQP